MRCFSKSSFHSHGEKIGGSQGPAAKLLQGEILREKSAALGCDQMEVGAGLWVPPHLDSWLG